MSAVSSPSERHGAADGAQPSALEVGNFSMSEASTTRPHHGRRRGPSMLDRRGGAPNADGTVPSTRRLTVLEPDDDGTSSAAAGAAPFNTRAALMASSAAPAEGMLRDDDAVDVDQTGGGDTATLRGSQFGGGMPPSSEVSHAASAAASHLRAARANVGGPASSSSLQPEHLTAATGGGVPTPRASAVVADGAAAAAAVSSSSPPLATSGSGEQQAAGGDVAVAASASRSDALDTAAEMQAASNRKWRSRRKHVFILSSAGRPIFTRWGNEFDFAELFGLLQTLVSLVGTSKEVLQRVSMGTHQMHFYSSRELTLVMVAATGESPRSCQDQLRLLELQLLSVLPNANDILERHPGFDVRNMFAAGDVRVMRNLIRRMSNDPAFLFGAVSVLPLPPAQRDSLHKVLIEHYAGDGPEEELDDDGEPIPVAEEDDTGEHLYAAVFAGGRVAACVQPDDFELPSLDFLLLMNFAYSVLTTRGEVWAPLCLPGVNDTGYLWCYVNVLRPDVLLVHVATSQHKFVELSVAASHIADRLNVAGLLDVLDVAARQPWPELPASLMRMGLQHLVVLKNDRMSISQLPSHICNKAHRKAYLRRLVQLRDQAIGVCHGSTPFLVSTDALETVLVELSGSVSQRTGNHATQVYAAFTPTTPRSDILGALTAVYKHISDTQAQLLMGDRVVTWDD